MSERERLRELALEALARLLAHQRRSGATNAAVKTSLRLLALDPLQEAVHRTLMRLYAQLGRRDAALRQYRQCVVVLHRELAVEPEAETKELYQELLRQRAVRGGTSPVAAGLSEAPAVGRDTEVKRLHEALGGALAGQGRVVAVLGEAGIGKTRLLAELAAEVEGRGGAVLLGRSHESEQILPFGPWLEGLRAGGALSEPSALDRLGEVWRVELARLFPELAHGKLPSPAGLVDQMRLFEALARLVRHLAVVQPLLVVLEDVHWADEMGVRFLAFLGRRLHDAPILIAVSARDDELADSPILSRTLDDLAAEHRLDRVTLFRLGREDTSTLVRFLGHGRRPAGSIGPVAELVWEASEGHPLMIVETMQEIRQGLTLPPGGDLPLPTRVYDMIVRRLGRLTERGEELLRLAAVIGRGFDFALLQQAAGLDAGEAATRFEELVRRRILHSVGDHFDVTHERIREVANRRLLPPRRAVLHAAVAKALEGLYAGDLAPHYAALGRHCREGRLWREAVTYLRLAGRQAVERAAHDDAVTLFQQALDALGHSPESPRMLEQAIDLRLDLADAMLASAHAPAILERLREAEALAISLGDRRRLARTLLGMTVQFRLQADYDLARDSAQRALAIAEALGDLPLRVGANTGLAQAQYARGDYRPAAMLFRRNVEAVGRHSSAELFGRLQPPSIHSRTWLVWSLAELGEFAEARAIAERCLQMARSLASPWALGFAYVGLGVLDLRMGALECAIRTLEPALDLARTWDIPLWLPRIGGGLGYAYALSGRSAEGLTLLEQALATKVDAWHSLILANLGEAYLLAARAREASEAADSALELSRKYKERGHEAWCLRLLGEIASCEGRPRDGETRFRETIALATGLGMRPLVAHCHLGLAKLYRRTADEAKADEHLACATAMYRDMDMSFWRDKAASY